MFMPFFSTCGESPQSYIRTGSSKVYFSSTIRKLRHNLLRSHAVSYYIKSKIVCPPQFPTLLCGIQLYYSLFPRKFPYLTIYQRVVIERKSGRQPQYTVTIPLNTNIGPKSLGQTGFVAFTLSLSQDVSCPFFFLPLFKPHGNCSLSFL